MKFIKDGNDGPIPAGLGGTPVVHLVSELLNRGRDVVVFSLARDVDDEVILQGEGLKICIGPYRSRARTRVMDFFSQERNYIQRAITREKPDFVHAHWAYEFGLGALAADRNALITNHDAPLQILRFNPSLYRLIRALMAFQTFSKARQMTSVSSYVAEHIVKKFHYRGKMFVIPNGLPDDQFSFNNQSPSRKDGKFVFASILVGWAGIKNGQTLIKAFQIVKKAIPQAELWMFGDGHGPNESAEIWAKKNHIEEGCHFVGGIPYPELIKTISTEVDVLVHPALEEACPMALIECMALEKPVIAGRQSGGVSYVLDRGNAGKLTDVSSPQDIAASMIDFAKDKECRDGFAKRGYIFAKSNFTIKEVTDQYEDIYRKILTHGSVEF